MRRLIDTVLSRPSRLRDEERGATAVIVVLSLIALFGMIVLTVDVGQLLFKRRAMVNASDAAALAAAQSCAGLDDTDVPEGMADAFALDNVSVANSGAANIIDIAGCDGPPFGHVTVEYEMQQNLFFAGVLGFDGPAAVRTQATAGWGPAGEANPLPVVVYTGNDQGNCDIDEGMAIGVACYLWYDNDLFENSAFGFLNLCTESDPCSHGWDVDSGANCPNVGSSLRNDWIAGNWDGGPNNVNYPDPTYVCVVTGLSSDNWGELTQRVGDDLIFPVNDCATQVDNNGNIVGCDAFPNKYNIIGFIVLHLDAVLDSAAEWGGTAQTSCSPNNVDVTPGQIVPLSTFTGGQCPNGSTPSEVLDFEIEGEGQGSSPNWTYDDLNKQFTWTGPADRVDVDFDWWLDGECGQPPNNSSAVCIKVHTVEVRFGGSGVCEACPDFGLRAVRLCDQGYGTCPQDN
ncbi:MAG TPA: pilus assembly protein TadG-related protein [Actinomycetota bacterium]|nr:pilus assembly protein TadG-related protein [Actinomycetota bacterium]